MFANRGNLPSKKCYIACNPNAAIINHSRSHDRVKYYFYRSEYGKVKWLWWFSNTQAINRFRMFDYGVHKYIGENQDGIAIDEVWRVDMNSEHLKDAIFTRVNV